MSRLVRPRCNVTRTRDLRCKQNQYRTYWSKLFLRVAVNRLVASWPFARRLLLRALNEQVCRYVASIRRARPAIERYRRREPASGSKSAEEVRSAVASATEGTYPRGRVALAGWRVPGNGLGLRIRARRSDLQRREGDGSWREANRSAPIFACCASPASFRCYGRVVFS